MDAKGELVGIVSLGDVALRDRAKGAGKTLKRISEPAIGESRAF